jgi:uncharacterized protein (DUF927 family)
MESDEKLERFAVCIETLRVHKDQLREPYKSLVELFNAAAANLGEKSFASSARVAVSSKI